LVTKSPIKRKTTTGKVLITPVPFGEIDDKPLRLLEEHNISYMINPIGRRLREDELVEIIREYEALIAGTEPITAHVLQHAHNLRLIARVGVGLDNIDLNFARERGIAITYTPDAPSPAIADLTIAQMLAALRYTHAADRDMRKGVWRSRTGRSLSGCTIGVIGVGRTGRHVIRHLHSWDPIRILANDLVVDDELAKVLDFVWADKETIYRQADIITLHVPLTPQTRNMIGTKELAMMKEEAILINTSRGGVVNEVALVDTLRKRPSFIAAIDVFENEPYSGEMTSLENCLLTCHMGSATRDCRLRMEIEAVREVIHYFTGQPFINEVPEYEYRMQIVK
jgi:D-3-phosphoglycerate dehydrogenase